ncbi:MAG: tRNA dihydrouridine synthase DusB [Acidobacteria bacterium]|nr:MAG: tRNA dihydrouridine synthase DusB [Acidobacteriota bacterium]
MFSLKSVLIDPPAGIAPMAGMTDSAFRRLVKREGGCGLVVTEMVSSEGLVRGIGRTLAYTEFTEEERPVSVQIFGGDPSRMAEAARVVESTGADVVDVNMGCPVPKISKHQAGCSLMREPAQAAAIVSAMTRAVTIPVTVKMRAGWNEDEVNAPELARRLEDAGASAITVHGRTAAQAYSGSSDWALIARVAASVRLPVFGNGDCTRPEHLLEWRQASGVAGVLVGRGVLRNPWIFAQAAEIGRGAASREPALADRARFLLEYIDLLQNERVGEPKGFRHRAGRVDEAARAAGHDRWVIGKVRALCAWFTKGLEGGSDVRVAVNRAASIAELRETISSFFEGVRLRPAASLRASADKPALAHGATLDE